MSETATYDDVVSLLRDLERDGYDVVDIVTDTSTAEVDDKMVQVFVERDSA